MNPQRRRGCFYPCDQFVQNPRRRPPNIDRIPQNKMSVFASGLKVKEDDSELKQELAKKIRRIFATGVTEENYADFFQHLLWYEETIVKINMKKYNMRNVPLQVAKSYNSYKLMVPDLGDKKLSLMCGDVLNLRPRQSDDTFEAMITKISNKKDKVTLKGLNRQFRKYSTLDSNNPLQLQAKFDVEFIMSRTSFVRMHGVLPAYVQGSPIHRRVFPMPNNTPAPYKIKKFYNKLVEQNSEQRSAVEHIVGGTAGTAPYLLHGPPGTGKTVTVVEAILQLLTKDPSNRILVCTDSNMAADHVAASLIKYAERIQQENFLLRACSTSRDWSTLPKCLEEYTDRAYEVKVKRIVGQTRCAYVTNMFKSHRIVVTTLSYAASFPSECTTKHLFIDEAAQASEPACLIPIYGLLSKSGSLTLSGDPQQLGPVIMSPHASKLGLGLSLMERLMTTCELYSSNDANYTLMLRNNFRSDPAILRISNDLFYNGQLRALATSDPLSSVDILGERKRSRAIVFHGVLSKEQKMGNSSSFFNNKELELVKKYIKMLINNHKVRPGDIGVVTPYLLQVSKVRNWLQETPWSDLIEVGSVEAFQGKEKRVIIISTVRSETQLGFLKDDQRFNVALTRAKAKAVVIGNPLCLQRDVKWRTYMQHCREYGTYFGHDSADRDLEELQNLSDRLNRLRLARLRLT